MPKHTGSNGIALKPQMLLGWQLIDRTLRTTAGLRKSPHDLQCGVGAIAADPMKVIFATSQFNMAWPTAFHTYHFCRPYQSLTSFVA